MGAELTAGLIKVLFLGLNFAGYATIGINKNPMS